MNREGAETYLRVMAEGQLRGSIAAGRGQPWGGPAGRVAAIMLVSQALTAVRAIDQETVEDILTGLDLAMSVRSPPEEPAGAAGTGASGPRRRRVARTGPMIPAATRPLPPPAQPDPDAGPDQFVPVGLRLPYRHEPLNGALFLLSFTHTAAGARFFAAWRTHSLFGAHPVQGGEMPDAAFTVTDDRGGRYRLELTPDSFNPGECGELALHPEPPDDVRWLDVGAPGGSLVRVELSSPEAADEPRASPLTLSPGEHLLTMLAERLLTTAPQLPPDLRRQLGTLPLTPGPSRSIAFGLGDVVAGLEAADVLSPLSPVPGQVAAVCAGLRVSGHGITAPPARVLPEPWLSLLAHYQRRKPGTAPGHDGYAAVATALPELDGIRVALLGVLNTDGESFVQLLARGLAPDRRPGLYNMDFDFPLSFWVRDSAGRWHAGRSSGIHQARGESAVRLQLVPPLARSTEAIEVLAAGRSARVRVRLPLRWGFP